MSVFFGATLMIVDAKPSSKFRKRVNARHAAGKCLKCEKDAANGRRGLCVTHYFQFRTSYYKLPLNERPLFEVKEVKNGKILPAQPGKKVERGIVA